MIRFVLNASEHTLFNEQDIHGHHYTGGRNSPMESRADYRCLVEGSPQSLLLREDELLESRDRLHVRTRTYHQQTKDDEAVERIDVGHCSV